jgi:hypothetical protein
MDFKYHLETAWRLTLKFIVSFVLMTLVTLALSCITLGILAPVLMAGYTQAILLALREGREPKVQDIFLEMRLFFPLLGFSVACFIAVMIGFMLFFLPGILVVMAISYACFFLIPFMTDRGLNLVHALKESYAASVEGNKVEHLIAVILFVAISAIGGTFIIGSVITMPLATAFMVSIYEERFKAGSPPQMSSTP